MGHNLPIKDKEIEEDLGDEESFSSHPKEKENDVSVPEPPQNQNFRGKKNLEVMQSGRPLSDSQFANLKKPSDRMWSEDDEIVILEGLINYHANKKVDPKTTHLDGFFEFVKKSVQFDGSKSQLRNKVRNLKRRYEICKKKVALKEGHEQIAFDLSKRIWGTESDVADHNVGSSLKDSRIALKKSTEDPVAFQRSAKRSRPNGEPHGTFMDCVQNLGIENWIEKVGMTIIKGEKGREMKEKWKEFKVRELEVYVKKLELLIKQTKLILEAMKASHH